MTEDILLANKKLNEWCGTSDINYYEGVTALGYLFKYVVPKFRYCSLTKPEHPSYKGLWLCEVRINRIRGYGENKDPAFALSEAAYKAFGGKV